MRFISFAGIGVVALALAGCAVTTPQTGTVPTAPTTTPATPTTLDAASRQVARNVIHSEIQKRYPGVDATPFSDCVVNNATTAELIDIAQASQAGVAGVSDSIAAIVNRPATSECLVSATQRA